ncbi:hypothetical protein [Lacticaseibacillus camelliae]|uniref:hypothetical protein n=1 Tax=Lacticaseibacillus camelliae TaxID=381742 RepID=UPI000B2F903A|nr:hypothetical protein [Lacticaseibacillus camelliae]
MDRRDSRSQHHRHPLAKVIVLLALTVVFLAGGYALRLYAQTKNALDTTYDNHTAKKNARRPQQAEAVFRAAAGHGHRRPRAQ